MAPMALHRSYSGQNTPAHSYLEHTVRTSRAESRENAAVRPVSARSWHNSVRSTSAGAPAATSCASLLVYVIFRASLVSVNSRRAGKQIVRARFAVCTSVCTE